MSFLNFLFILTAGALFFMAVPGFLANLYFYLICAKRRKKHFFKELTLIKPLRGADIHLLNNLRTHLRFKPEGSFQMILAMESKEDEAYAAGQELKREYPREDIEILITGPSGARMGKIHNMIEAMKIAKYSLIAFSDGDAKIDKETFPRALETMTEADGAFLPPYYEDPVNLGSAILSGFTNYFYFPGIAVLELLGLVDFCSGGFMIYKRSALEAIGGLEQFADCMADDGAIGQALWRKGLKIRVVPKLLFMPPEVKSPWKAVLHIRRWSITIREFLGLRYYLFPAAFMGSNVTLLLGLSLATGQKIQWCLGLFFTALIFRLVGLPIQDWMVKGRLGPIGGYFLMILLDILCLPLWILTLWGRKVEWRGKRYEILPGGRVRVLGETPN